MHGFLYIVRTLRYRFRTSVCRKLLIHIQFNFLNQEVQLKILTQKSLIFISLIYIINASASSWNSPTEIDLLTTYDCIHLNPVTGEYEAYYMVDQYFEECPVYIHPEVERPPLIKRDRSNNLSEIYELIIWEENESDVGYPAQPYHRRDDPGSHDCDFGLGLHPPE